MYYWNNVQAERYGIRWHDFKGYESLWEMLLAFFFRIMLMCWNQSWTLCFDCKEQLRKTTILLSSMQSSVRPVSAVSPWGRCQVFAGWSWWQSSSRCLATSGRLQARSGWKIGHPVQLSEVLASPETVSKVRDQASELQVSAVCPSCPMLKCNLLVWRHWSTANWKRSSAWPRLGKFLQFTSLMHWSHPSSSHIGLLSICRYVVFGVECNLSWTCERQWIMVEALLMLSNVSLSMDLESPVAEVVRGSKTLRFSTFAWPCWNAPL